MKPDPDHHLSNPMANQEAALLQPDSMTLAKYKSAKAGRPHDYWRAGEPDCPKDIKAPNGELHTLRCRVCGQDDPPKMFCFGASQALDGAAGPADGLPTVESVLESEIRSAEYSHGTPLPADGWRDVALGMRDWARKLDDMRRGAAEGAAEDALRLNWLATHSYREGGRGGYAPVYVIAHSSAWPAGALADAEKPEALRRAIDHAMRGPNEKVSRDHDCE